MVLILVGYGLVVSSFFLNPGLRVAICGGWTKRWARRRLVCYGFCIIFFERNGVEIMTRQNISSISHLPLVGFLCAAILTGCVPPMDENVETNDSASTAPVIAVKPAESGLPTSEQWAKLRNCEASGRYDISSANGVYHGAYQFKQESWDATARKVGRDDLVGVKPSVASSEDQDTLAVALFRESGSKPWGPKCGAFLN